MAPPLPLSAAPASYAQGRIASDGKDWSEHQVQSEYIEFEEPESNTPLNIENLDLYYSFTFDSLMVVGTDTAGFSDVWISTRGISDIQDWYPSEAPGGWTEPELIATAFEPMQALQIENDNKNHTHVFWIQLADTREVQVRQIYKTEWDGENWFSPRPLFQLLEHAPKQLSLELGLDERLYLVWDDLNSGDIFYSQASVEQSNSTDDWTEPSAIPIPWPAGRSPELIVDGSKLFTIYAIPLNEGRGIYLTGSTDTGLTWDAPQQVFDGVQAEWEMVDNPSLAFSSDGSMHAIFTQYSLPDGIGPLSLHYALSRHGGENWYENGIVVDGSISWSQVVNTSNNLLHRVWMESSASQKGIHHQYSTDSGVTWSFPASIAVFGESHSPAALTQDQSGRLHLLLLQTDSDGKQQLSSWIWNGERWSVESQLELGLKQSIDYSDLSVDMSMNGRLSVIFNSMSWDEETEMPIYELYYSQRQLKIPDTIPQITPLIPEPTITPRPTSTILPTATTTPLIPTQSDLVASGVGPTDNSWSAALIATGVAGFIVIALFGFYWFLIKPNRR